MSDNDLIRGIRENSPQAWREIYHGNIGPIRARIGPMLQRTRDREFYDLYDEAMIQLLECVKSGRLKEGENSNLSGYLYAICWRMACRWEKKSLPVGSVEKLPDGPTDEDPTAEQYEELMRFLEELLKKIPENCRKLLRLFYWEKLSMKEIAPTLGLRNEDSAKTGKNKCMNKLKNIAQAMMQDGMAPEVLEELVGRAVERDALFDLLQDLRQEDIGQLRLAANNNKEK